jgi:hypothetical protein
VAGVGLDPRHSCGAGGLAGTGQVTVSGAGRGRSAVKANRVRNGTGVSNGAPPVFTAPSGGAFLKPRPLGVDSYQFLPPARPRNGPRGGISCNSTSSRFSGPAKWLNRKKRAYD